MLRLHESSDPLSNTEKELYNPHLKELGLDANIWEVYDQFLKVSSPYSTPRIIRFLNNDKQLGHAYMIRCKNHGATISRLWIVKFFMKLIGMPVYSWMKSGIAAENFANPAFTVRNGPATLETNSIILTFKRKYFLLFILDFNKNSDQYPDSLVLPYSDEGMVDTTDYTSAADYLLQHKNLKKKFKEYRKHDGRVDIKTGVLSEDEQAQVHASVYSTSKKSIFKLPYQDIYPDMCKASADIKNDRIVHFLCRSDTEFFGYHSFIQFGNQMRCLNGAFNRDLRSTYHAYENMIYKVVEYAIENKIQMVYFGHVLNETKKRMMNTFLPTSLFVYSKFPIVIKLFAPVFKNSRMTDKRILAFSGIHKN